MQNKLEKGNEDKENGRRIWSFAEKISEKWERKV